MLTIFHFFREMTFASVAMRLLLAFICGGAIGLERTYRRRSAGFRTHILICLGASATTLCSQYLYLYMHYYTDMARLGAQVIAGIGFIGAGTIIVTQRQRVKGLTTAAGLWAVAIVGLAIGAGFVEGGILTTALILLSEIYFSRLEHRLLESTPEINIYVEYDARTALEELLRLCKTRRVLVLNLEITRSSITKKHNATALITMRFHKPQKVSEILSRIRMIDGIVSVEEL